MLVPVAPAERRTHSDYGDVTDSVADDDGRVDAPAYCPVLIVEDDEDLREMMAQMLSLEGFRSHAVANGRDALAFLEHSDPPRLILLDMMMPVMDGWEFRREQQRQAALARVPVIVLSALDEPRVGDIGASAFLKKPLDFDRLLRLVRQHCGR